MKISLCVLKVEIYQPYVSGEGTVLTNLSDTGIAVERDDTDSVRCEFWQQGMGVRIGRDVIKVGGNSRGGCLPVFLPFRSDLRIYIIKSTFRLTMKHVR